MDLDNIKLKNGSKIKINNVAVKQLIGLYDDLLLKKLNQIEKGTIIPT